MSVGREFVAADQRAQRFASGGHVGEPLFNSQRRHLASWLPHGYPKGASMAVNTANYAEGGSVEGYPPLPDPIDAKAHEAATSPKNDLPEPTDGQKEAGNYRMGHVRINGMDVTIENPAGSTRSGTDANGKPWETEMANHYGYLRGTLGRDKDHIDVFLGPKVGDPQTPVHVVDQLKRDGSFDEHKVMLGFPSEDHAVNAYHANYEPGWGGFGDITAMPLDKFKSWAMAPGRRVKPVGSP